MVTELDVLELVGDRLTSRGIPFMLTGSFAMAHYTVPRMTRDLDIVVELQRRDVEHLLNGPVDTDYLRLWAPVLGIERIAASLYETARAIVESSLPNGLTREQKRYATAKRFYGDELAEAALVAYAKFGESL